MTEIGESVNPFMLLDPVLKCPFSHEAPAKRSIANVFIGSGSTLQTKMGNATSTFVKSGPLHAANKEGKKFPNPKATAGHPFHASKQPPVELDLQRDGDAGDLVKYKVSCAAHHLVPAQEALKSSKLLAYMLEHGKKGSVKTGKKTEKSKATGKCFWNAGYDVNGAENGVFLPGSYAVSGSKAGKKRWTPLKSWAPPTEPEEEDQPEDGDVDIPTDPSTMLTGDTVEIDPSNRKWLYVSQVVKKASGFAKRGYGGQFHDRHEDYSDRVLDMLDEMHDSYKEGEAKSFSVDAECPDCKKVREEHDKLKGIPTPFEVVDRINRMSRKLEDRLTGMLWNQKFYTSKWGQQYMKSKGQSFFK